MTIAVFIVYKTNKKILHWSEISFFFFNMKRGTGILTTNNYIPYKYKFKVNFLSVQSMFVSFISNYKFSDILH